MSLRDAPISPLVLRGAGIGISQSWALSRYGITILTWTSAACHSSVWQSWIIGRLQTLQKSLASLQYRRSTRWENAMPHETALLLSSSTGTKAANTGPHPLWRHFRYYLWHRRVYRSVRGSLSTRPSPRSSSRFRPVGDLPPRFEQIREIEGSSCLPYFKFCKHSCYHENFNPFFHMCWQSAPTLQPDSHSGWFMSACGCSECKLSSSACSLSWDLSSQLPSYRGDCLYSNSVKYAFLTSPAVKILVWIHKIWELWCQVWCKLPVISIHSLKSLRKLMVPHKD